MKYGCRVVGVLGTALALVWFAGDCGGGASLNAGSPGAAGSGRVSSARGGDAGVATGSGGVGGSPAGGMGGGGGEPPGSAGSVGSGGSSVSSGTGGVVATGGTSGTGDARSSNDVAGDAGTQPATGLFPSPNDFGVAGPFATTRDVNTGPDKTYDVFRPAMLGAEGRKHPIVSWTNGTLFTLDQYAKLLAHWASHGIVVIAAHTNTTAGGGTHKAGIAWLKAENARAGGPYEGKLDVAKLGVSGHSQGGGAAIAAGSDATLGLGGILPLMGLLKFEADQTVVSRQTAPIFDVVATMDDRDPTGAIANQIFNDAKGEIVQAAYIGIHEDAMNAVMWAPTLAFWRWRFFADAAGEAFFHPATTCRLCSDKAWKTVRAKGGM